MTRAPVLALVACAALLAGCSESSSAGGGGGGGGSAGPTGCRMEFAGAYDDASTTTDACASLAKGDDGAWVLHLTLSASKRMVSTKVDVDLGARPAAGTFTAATVSTWDAVGVDGSACEYAAGSESVPPGSFTLDLTDLGPLDAQSPEVHGSFEAVESVHAPLMVDCGSSDAETIAVVF